MLNPHEEIAENDPVRVVDSLAESLYLREFKKLYREKGRCPYHPKMMLNIILYTYMKNIYSCRKKSSVSCSGPSPVGLQLVVFDLYLAAASALFAYIAEHIL